MRSAAAMHLRSRASRPFLIGGLALLALGLAGCPSTPSKETQRLEQLEGMAAGGETGIADSLHAVAEGIRRRGLVIVVSDLIDEPDDVMTGCASTGPTAARRTCPAPRNREPGPVADLDTGRP